ncbi:MAG: efflux RND transporter permease subunit, partial [Nonlabens sp.]|nr:efflux RND transporter permease subunit [Nonlabens sp.]
FAVQKRQDGATILEAAIEGAKMRFRPILMTSFAFVAGLIPLVLASGAGAIGNRTIGGSAMGGMLIGTSLGVLVIPGLYYVFASLADGRGLIKGETHEPISEEFVRTANENRETKQEVSKLRSILEKMKRKDKNSKL